jgi:hypothetical protein
MGTLVVDLRYGSRMLMKTPGFSGIALALAIGAKLPAARAAADKRGVPEGMQLWLKK